MTHTIGLERTRGRVRWLVVAVLGLAGCSLDKLLNTDQLPTNVTDPAITRTPEGALAAYHGLLLLFRDAFGGRDGQAVVSAGGLLTDELHSVLYQGDEDRRLFLTFGNDRTYRPLQQVRGQAGQAIGLLTDYAPEQQVLVGHAYALEGYAEVFLAELYCSGIPLSTLDYNGDYTYQLGSTTAQVFTHAAALFDTALTLVGDSARFLHLAAVGKGRALLARGQYAEAAAAVATVPDTFRYEVPYTAELSDNVPLAPNFGYRSNYDVADQEGVNGLNYITSGDPRTPVTFRPATGSVFGNNYRSAYYSADRLGNGDSALVLASGVEARLIEAEVALQAGDVATWLTTLNQLRTNGVSTSFPTHTIVDTLGVTGCLPFPDYCGGPSPPSSPRSDSTRGLPAGFPSAGYSLVSADTTWPAPPGIKDFCGQFSWYEPCYSGDTMVVSVYVRPAGASWEAGTGGVANLAPLADPGSAAGRVDLLFRERAFWLFLTGHRQGDLRRLIRQYGRLESQLYPVGPYPRTSLLYGSDVTLPIPREEREINPLFTGCASRGA